MRTLESTVRSRIAASVALAAAVMLGATGCNMMSPQDTTIDYDPSDGVSVELGPVEVRNLLVISDDAGLGNLVFVAVNNQQADATLNLEYRDADGARVSRQVELASGLNQFGFGEHEQILLEGLSARAGENLELYLQSGAVEGVERMVPVLNNLLGEYEQLLPTLPPVVEPEEGPAEDVDADAADAEAAG